MNPQRYGLIVAIVFAAIAVLQLARAVLGWPVAVTTPWGTLMIRCGLAGSRVLQRSSSPGSDTPPRGPIRRSRSQWNIAKSVLGKGLRQQQMSVAHVDLPEAREPLLNVLSGEMRTPNDGS